MKLCGRVRALASHWHSMQSADVARPPLSLSLCPSRTNERGIWADPPPSPVEPGQSDSTKLFALIDSSPLQQAAVSRSQSLPTPLHTAVRCAKLGTVDLVLRHLSSGPGNRLVNAKDLEGQTPLHLASSLGRPDVVMLLLSQPGIDDTLRDTHGRTPVEVAKGSDVATVLQGRRRLCTTKSLIVCSCSSVS